MADFIRICDYCGKTYDYNPNKGLKYCCFHHLQAHAEEDQVRRLVEYRDAERVMPGVITIKPMQPDRKLLVEQLEKVLNYPAVYCGAPSFSYKVRGYTVHRNGTIEVRSDKVSKKVLQSLADCGLIEPIELFKDDGISFSMDGFTGRTLSNIVFMFASKANLINKSIAVPNAFHVDDSLIHDLTKENPDTVSDFMRILSKNGGFKAMRGLYISNGRLFFVGFNPRANMDEKAAQRALAELMVNYAIKKLWARPYTVNVVNEKYYFRIWLNSIGMIGESYSRVRRILLQRLEGNQTYRLPEQKEAYDAKRRAMKEAAFVAL